MTLFRKATLDLSRIRPKAIKEAGVRKLLAEGRAAKRELVRRYRNETVYDGTHWARLLNTTKKWKQRKKKLGLRPERGQASRALVRALASPQSFIVREDGFTISPARANFSGVGGKPLNTYYRHYNASKAFSSIGVLSKRQRKDISSRTKQAMMKKVLSAMKSARGFWKGELLEIQLAIGEMKII